MSEGELAVVPDGDPCPTHGLPTRLITCGGGLMSQCQGCRDDFVTWYGQHTRHVVVVDPASRPAPAGYTPKAPKLPKRGAQMGLEL